MTCSSSHERVDVAWQCISERLWKCLVGRYGGCFEERYKKAYDDRAYRAKGFVRPDMRYCFRSEPSLPNPRTKHISVPLRHMTKSYIPDFNMISQHYRYKDTHLIQSAYNCLNTIQQRKIHV